MLLTGDNETLESDGWVIVSDHNGNDPPVNYNELSHTGSKLYTWNLKNNPGVYTIRGRVYFGTGTNFPQYVERELEIDIGLRDNDPPVLADITHTTLSDDTVNFEVLYQDKDGDMPREVWINLSRKGAYRMDLINQSKINWTGGAKFYHLMTLESGKYSFHVSAYDGTVWSESEKITFYMQLEDQEVNPFPLVLGIVIGIIAAVTVRTLRRR
jgi:hypothetical protein